ncbi:MAG: DEAD/DEAH box helicase, partial [Candidatus Eremiobacterota bacterium]
MSLSTLPFGPATARWFEANFPRPTPVQEQGWPAIARGEHCLLLAPTGSGKTLAAFLGCLDRLVSQPGQSPSGQRSALPSHPPTGVRVLYVSPLKALVYDVERNLQAPLVGIGRAAEALGLEARLPRVDIRTGDTPERARRNQRRHPAELLVTTPESLYLMLSSAARETLKTVETVILDEIHAVAGTKRGVHLALTLERLADNAERDPQRIGLSATVRPVDEVARFLGGPRPVRVVDASARPLLDLQVCVPVADMENPGEGGSILAELSRGTEAREPTGFLQALYPELLRLIHEHRTTIVFVNNRGMCERMAARLNELAGDPTAELVRAHHGSVSQNQRRDMEEQLKSGQLKAIVATSSLELGIDMGAVDLVLQIASPQAVARGLQRVGRAGHQVGEVSVGRIFPKFRGDLAECAVVAREMLEGRIEPLSVPSHALDVLAQQVVSIVATRDRTVEELERLVRRAYPYRELSRDLLVSVLDMLSGRYPSTDFADLRPRLNWDRETDVLSARPGAGSLAMVNGGTIPDRGLYGVYLGPEGPRVGELDEEMAYEVRRGQNFILGTTTWRIEDITRDRVVVSPAPGEPGRLPFWKGEGPGRTVELGRALGAFLREAGAQDDPEAWLLQQSPLDELAARNLAAYLQEQLEVTGTLPTDRAVTVERFRDELGDYRICILTPFGARVHAPWAMAIEGLLSHQAGFDVQALWSDDGIVLRAVEGEVDPEKLFPDPEEAEDLAIDQLRHTGLFASQFRENAGRSLLLPRRHPGQRTPLWSQRLKAQALLATASGYPSFPILLETYRSCLKDYFDLPALLEVLRGIRSREIRVDHVETTAPSPFARSLAFAYQAAYLYEGDTPLAERRAQALQLDRKMLRELLGHEELRQLLDPGALVEVERELQLRHRTVRHPDDLHDLLRQLGDLSQAEVAERAPVEWLPDLRRRVAPLRLAGQTRWIAAEDAALYRDGLGAALPGGIPAVFLEPAERPLETLFLRYGRTHGPFTTRDLASRFGLTDGQVEP